MSPQLQEVFAQAQKLHHAEQLQLITHLVNHALPIVVEPPVVTGEIVDEAIVDMHPPVVPIDPQCAEFLDEIVQYRRDQQN
ncbi:hypothetical protein IQ266_23065 [filamentous cyanobacterium LEGE 11480]|uniref:Uncharacterized protein n=1 Tax=Romeriopsis navalis LEGE 11480 TaxID=2777977 RepID=A0A928VPY9_9CYAN|nr:hypothetical protein [Romeriopsis navalis]MBE9032623.1 hypothetical protein [Romeriopsis navalis LEGE 11480]